MWIEGSRVEEKRMALLEQVDSAAAFLFAPECQYALAMMEWSEQLVVEAEILMAEYSMLLLAGWLVSKSRKKYISRTASHCRSGK